MPYSAEIARVLGEPAGVLAGLSGAKAAIRLIGRGYELSDQTLLDAKSGKFGRNGETLRVIARAMAPELLSRFGEEIGGGAPEDVERWLLDLAFPNAAQAKATPEDERVAIARLAAEEAVRLFQVAQAGQERTPAERLLDWTQDYEKRWGEPMVLHFRGGAASLTHEAVDRIIELHEREAEEEARQKREPVNKSRIEAIKENLKEGQQA